MEKHARITLLLVDNGLPDSALILETVGRYLPDATILIADRDMPWMNRAAVEDPDVILLNSAKVGGEVLEECRQLKEVERLKTIPILLLMEREENVGVLSDAINSGIKGFVFKPLDPLQLAANIISLAKAKSTIRKSKAENSNIRSLLMEHEKEIHVGEKKYKTLISKMMNAFALHELLYDERGEPFDYRFLEVNPAWEKIVGIKAEKIIGKTIREIMPDIEEKWIALYGTVVRTGVPQEFTDYNGATNKYYDVFAFPSSGAKFAVFFNDVTDQIKSDILLKESEGKFRSIAESLSDFIALTDHAGVIMYASPASLAIFGLAPHEMAGRIFTDFIERTFLPKALDAFRDMVENGASLSKEEFLLRRQNGSLFYGEVSGKAHAVGSMNGTLVTIRDINDRKQMERQKLYQQARLQSLVRILQHQSKNAQEFLDYALQEIISLTESEIGYIYFYSEEKKEFTLNTWSKHVMEQCSVANPSKVYQLEKTGIWGEAVRQRKEIMINDFRAPDPLMKGHPEGHVQLRNFLTVPIFKDNQIVAVAGVANKKCDYDSDDILQMQLLMNNVWKEVESKKNVQALEESERRFSIAQELSPDGFTILRPVRDSSGVVVDFIWVYENPAIARINGTVPSEVVGKSLLGLFPSHKGTAIFNTYIEAAVSRETQIIDEVNVGAVIEKPLWLRLVIESMGEDIAIMAIDITERKKYSERLRTMLDGTVQTIAQIVETRDPYTAGHEQRVANLASAIAARIGLAPDRIEGLHKACLLHDIGKILIPLEILSMPRKLTPVEYSLIKVHPRAGYDILKEIDFPWPVARVALEHHERMDGSGYPNGLAGENICLESRILAVADVVEAMTSHRPYRPGLGIGAALEEITSKKGSLYDPEVVDACIYVFKEQKYAM